MTMDQTRLTTPDDDASVPDPAPDPAPGTEIQLDSALLVQALSAARTVILAHKDEIAALDQAIGDGDHVFNLLRGLDAALADSQALLELELAAALRSVARTLLESVGGSAGPLLASLVLGMAKALQAPVTAAGFARMFGSGVQALQLRGKAERGEKTMLDVLLPTAECLSALVGSGLPLGARLERVRQVAGQGMESTRDLVATKGRAAFLGERARGVVDPGARSTQLMITAVCDLLDQRAAFPSSTPGAP